MKPRQLGAMSYGFWERNLLSRARQEELERQSNGDTETFCTLLKQAYDEYVQKTIKDIQEINSHER